MLRASLLLVLFAPAPAAHAMRWEDMRRSDNVEDRRDHVVYDVSIHDAIVLHGKGAAQLKMPYRCPGLRESRAPEMAEIANDLEKAKSLLARKEKLNEATAELSRKVLEGTGAIGGSPDACQGAKDAVISQLEQQYNIVQAAQKEIQRDHRPITEKVLRFLVVTADGGAPARTIGDRINNWASGCPDMVKRYLESFRPYLKRYVEQYQHLDEHLTWYQTAIQQQARKILEIRCGDARVEPARRRPDASPPRPVPRPKR